MKLPIYNIVLDETQGLTCMSLVQSPAVESDFLAFSKEEKIKFSVDEEQHIVLGCALRADYPIYRIIRGEECEVVFGKEVIKQLVEKFFKDGLIKVVNTEHTLDVDGVYLVYSFLKDSSKGLSPDGFDDVSDGSWFVGYKIENPVVWEKVKSGEFKGFSVEVTCEIVPEEKEITDFNEFYNELINNK